MPKVNKVNYKKTPKFNKALANINKCTIIAI